MSEIKDLKEVKNQRGYLQFCHDVTQKHSKAAQRLLELAINQFTMAFKDAEQGQQVIWTTLKCIPLIYASGVKPLMMADIVRYGESELITEVENSFRIPAEICSMIKAEYGSLHRYRNTAVKRIAVAPYIQCEPTMLVTAAMEEFGYDTYMADVVERPKNMSDKRKQDFKDMLRHEYIKFAKWMSGTDIAQEKLRIELERSNRIKDKVSYLEELEKEHNLYLRTVASMLVRCGVESYYAQPVLYEEILDQLIEEMEALPEGAYHDETIPKIIWSGARGVDFSAFTAVDLVGGQVVYWNLVCNLEKRYDLSLEPLEALLKHDYEASGTSGIEEMCRVDERYMRENNAKGIILFQTQGCTYNSVSFELRRRKFSEKKIPVLLLTGNTQYGEINGQTLMRMEAFMEMLR